MLLTGNARSTLYDAPAVRTGDVDLLKAISDKFEAYTTRRKWS